MTDQTAPAAEPEVVDPSTEIVPGPPPAGEMLPAGVTPSRNYQQAVELGRVLADSGYFADARSTAQAAVKVMVGMDLGISPTAALRAIHTIGDGDKTNFVIEGKVLGALIKARPGYDYKIVERSDETCTITFLRNDEPMHPDVTYTMADARRAGLTEKKNWKRHPREMLTWRCLAEGQRIHMPELTAGQPVFTDAEFGEEDGIRDALREDRPPPLSDDKAEALREQAREAYDRLKAINPERVPPGRYASMVAQAEHSHARLQAVVDSLTDLADTEQQIADLSSTIADAIPKDAHKKLIERAERRGSNRERLDLLREAAVEAGVAIDDTTEGGDENGSSDDTDGADEPAA